MLTSYSCLSDCFNCANSLINTSIQQDCLSSVKNYTSHLKMQPLSKCYLQKITSSLAKKNRLEKELQLILARLERPVICFRGCLLYTSDAADE